MLMPIAPRRFFYCLALIISVFHSVLGSTQEFQAARPGYVFQFPRDHGAHPEFKTEWWYYSGHLKSKEGESFGYQLTFFRAALAPPNPKARSAWAAHTVYFAHLALTDPVRRTFTFREKAMRGALGLAGAEIRKYFLITPSLSAQPGSRF